MEKQTKLTDEFDKEEDTKMFNKMVEDFRKQVDCFVVVA
jgi:hypothetical protein